MTGQLPGPQARFLDAAERWLEEARGVLASAEAEGEALSGSLAELRDKGARLEAPLVILLVGGTGAGKSTLLNALAGDEIAAASAVRPTTSALTAYLHERAALLLPEGLRAFVTERRHRRAALRHKVLVDAPDFDSQVREHHERLEAALAACDLVIALATPEKYANHALYTLLARFREGRTFVFALNRLDQGIDDDARTDFAELLEGIGFERQEVLRLSAREALAARLDGDEPDEGRAGDFLRLERHIAEELDRVRARELKQRNLDALFRRAAAGLRRLVPEDLDARLDALDAEAARVAGGVAERAAARAAATLRANAALARDLEARAAMAYGGPLGAWQALSWSLRAIRGRGPLPGAVGAALAAVGGRAIGELPAGEGAVELGLDLAEEADLAARRIDILCGEAGLVPPFAAEPVPAEGDGEDAAHRLERRARRAAREEVARALEQARREPASRSLARRAEGLLLNAPALAIVGFSLYRWCEGYVAGVYLPPGFFTVTLAAAASALWVSGRVADAIARGRAARALDRLAAAASAAVEREVTAPLVARARAVADAAQRLREALPGTDRGPSRGSEDGKGSSA